MTESLNKINLLTKALLKNSTADNDPTKHKGLKIAVTIIGSSIMILCAVMVGYFTHLLTVAVKLLNGNGTEAAQLIMYFISIFGAVFGINVICGLLYFSVDMSRLLPYPFKPAEICMSKFTVGYLQESIMEFLVVVGILAGYMIADGVTVLGVIFAVFGVVLLPVLPLFYCGLFSIIIMSFTKKVRSAKSIHLVSTLCGVVFVLVFVVSLLQLDNITAESFINSLAEGTNVFMNIMQYVFFTVPMLCFAISQQNILLFIAFVAVHFVMWLVIYMLSSKLYMSGVSAVLSSGKKQIYSDKKHESHSMFTACLQREVKTLLRTPTYIMNCVAPNALLPLAGLIILCTNGGGVIQQLVNSMQAPDTVILLAVIIASALVSAMSGISSSAFTREGNHADLLKYIPVPYKTQFNSKLVTALIFSLPACVVGVVLVCVAINTGVAFTIMCIFGSALTVVCTVYSGILFDALHPKFVWDDELSALRGNMSTFLHMAVAIAVGIVLAVLYFVFSSLLIAPVVLALLLVVTAVLAVYVPKRTIQLIEEMEI